MRVVIQRVSEASVTIAGQRVSEIKGGLLALTGFAVDDTDREVLWMAKKLSDLRIFEDAERKMNLSIRETGGSVLVVSQFTVYGDARKGNRPNFMAAAEPAKALELYNRFVAELRATLGAERIQTGEFQAMMQVQLVNEGPVTIILERTATEGPGKNP